MTRQEAERYIAHLTLAEKQQLNELLSSLEQMRPPAPAPLASTDTSDL